MADTTEEEESGGYYYNSFDGNLESWPKDLLRATIVPTEKEDFIRYMACELFKNQNISDPRSQARRSIDNAIVMYDCLRSRGFI